MASYRVTDELQVTNQSFTVLSSLFVPNPSTFRRRKLLQVDI
jgi:hypothetical protein